MDRVIVLYGNTGYDTARVQCICDAFHPVEDICVLNFANHAVDFDEISASRADRALFVRSDVYGPAKTLNPMLAEFDQHSEDVVGLILQPPYAEGQDDEFDEGISVECFQLSSRILEDQNIEDIFDKLQEQANNRFRKMEKTGILSELRNQGYTIGGVINKGNFADFSVDAGYDYVKNKSYELLKDTVCPFIFKRRFEADNNLNDDLNRTLDYAKNHLHFDVDMMLDDVARTINPLDSKRNLNLNYIIPSQLSLTNDFNCSIYSETAVFAHIYYEDRVEDCLRYLKHIPDKIHKYLTTSNQATYAVLKKYVDSADSSWHLQMVRNHGRDMSALWVVDAPIMKKYKYVCYVHDKKTSGQKGNILNGDYFHYNVWENSLKSSTYINNVLYILSTREKLGFLSPPFPIFFDYKGLLGNEWTICYEPTVKLANDLEIQANLDENKPPFAFSNTFWAKTDALLPLIEREFRYEDFLGEPLPIDGTISHAIERIYIYCAQSQGYFSGIMEHDRYASMELNSMQKVMAARNVKLNQKMEECGQLRQRLNQLQREFDVYKLAFDKASSIIHTSRACCSVLNPEGRILIYGCGIIGHRVAERLQQAGFHVDYFLVSDGQPMDEQVMGIPCAHYSDVCIADSDNVIIALNLANYEQVRELLTPIKNKVMHSELNI